MVGIIFSANLYIRLGIEAFTTCGLSDLDDALHPAHPCRSISAGELELGVKSLLLTICFPSFSKDKDAYIVDYVEITWN
jgi:hypothetical protein